MTVNEVMAELQRLSAKGWGDAVVIVRDQETDSHYASDRDVTSVRAKPEYVNQPHVLID